MSTNSEDADGNSWRIPKDRIQEQLNTPIVPSEYIEKYVDQNGLQKGSDGMGGQAHLNPAANQMSSWACGHCKKGCIKLKKCGACGVVGYCSKECQRAAWPSHKALCKEMAKNNREGGPEVEARAHETTSSERLTKWLMTVPGFNARLRKLVSESAVTPPQVPFFIVRGGTNPFVCVIQEGEESMYEEAKRLVPEMKHYLRPLTAADMASNAQTGMRSYALMVQRGTDVCMLRGRI
tara:strand:- start:9969 stop:10676 length:708 start_codon:yes stop_codon:yes gene_type:complete